ncbi:MAG: 50S ribosomal protein L3 [bacterium]|nr:50S ribosomal protein L3 [bacterium]
MFSSLIGRKVGMTQIFGEKGEVIPVTLIEAGPCVVLQKKASDQEGYEAIQLGYEDIKEKKLTKSLRAKFTKIKVEPKRYIREFRVNNPNDYEVGQELKVDIFEEGSFVDVCGTSKGKGFAGVIKRWGFKGGPKSHGSRFHRAPGSIGASSSPSRVFKGQKLPGHMGNKKVTIQSLEIVRLDKEKNLLVIKGAVPGASRGIVIIKQAMKKDKKQ